MLFFCLINIFIVLALFNSGIYGTRYSAAGLYWDFASRVMHGQMVYRDFPMEYPPLSLLFFLLPRLFTSTYPAYAVGFTIEMLLFDLLGLVLVAAISRHLKMNLWLTLGIYTLSVAAIGPLLTDRYDLIPGVMTLAALYAFVKGKEKTAWGITAAGMMTKLFPAVIAPLFLIWNIRKREFRKLPGNFAAYAAVTLAFALPFLLLAPAGFIASFTYHLQRGLQVESTYASALLAERLVGLTNFGMGFDFGSWNLVSPLADSIARVSTIVFLALVGLVYWRYYRNQARSTQLSPDARDIPILLNYAILAVVAFVIAGKVFSPQFLLWLLPLVPLVAGRWRNILHWCFIAACVMTFYVFPTHYLDLIPTPQKLVSMVLILRNVVLIAFFVLLLLSSRSGGNRQKVV